MKKIRKAYVDVGSDQIHYLYSSGQGIPLLLFHRTPASSVIYKRMMRRMVGNRPIYALDTPGFGESFNPEGMPSVIDYRDWFCEAIDNLGISSFHIYAHHTGTHIATEIAVYWKNRVQSLMLNGVAYLTEKERLEFAKKILPATRPDEDGRYLMETWKIIKSLFPSFDRDLVHSEFIGALRAMDGRDQAFRAIWDQEFTKVLRQVECPVFAMSAANDFFAGYLDRIKENIPSARIALLGNAIVASPELDTDNTVRLLNEFMSGVESG
jgi:pimeloyl-ACP methyl ester carboxylesterase